MKKCIIFCAGGFDRLVQPIHPEDFIIAADGGLRHTQHLGITPQLVLGDFDSLGFIPEGAEVHPIEKDDTDSMLAIKEGLRRGCRTFVLYGCLDGHRVDHTVANFQALLFLKNRGATGFLVGLSQIAAVFQQETVNFPAHFKGTLSLFCLGDTANGITLKGLRYPLQKGDLTPDFPLGVSNRFTGEPASVSIDTGSLLAIWDTENGVILC